jgi:hypothetical protein
MGPIYIIHLPVCNIFSYYFLYISYNLTIVLSIVLAARSSEATTILTTILTTTNTIIYHKLISSIYWKEGRCIIWFNNGRMDNIVSCYSTCSAVVYVVARKILATTINREREEVTYGLSVYRWKDLARYCVAYCQLKIVVVVVLSVHQEASLRNRC